MIILPLTGIIIVINIKLLVLITNIIIIINNNKIKTLINVIKINNNNITLTIINIKKKLLQIKMIMQDPRLKISKLTNFNNKNKIIVNCISNSKIIVLVVIIFSRVNSNQTQIIHIWISNNQFIILILTIWINNIKRIKIYQKLITNWKILVNKKLLILYIQ